MSGRDSRIVARWESRSGAHTLTLIHDGYGYTYRSETMGGNMRAIDDVDAISQCLRGPLTYVQPDANKTPMRQVFPAPSAS